MLQCQPVLLLGCPQWRAGLRWVAPQRTQQGPPWPQVTPLRAAIGWWKLQDLAWLQPPGLLLPEQALQQCASRTAIGKMPLLITEEAPYRTPVLSPVLAPKIWRFLLPVHRRVVLHILGHGSWCHGLGWRSHGLRLLWRRKRGWWRLCSRYCRGGWKSQASCLWGSGGLSG